MPQRLAQALAAQRAATLALLTALAPDAWTTPCLPPWRVRDVAAHLVTVDEAAVTGRLLPVVRAGERGDRAAIERWNDAAVAGASAATPDELVEGLERWGARLERLVRRLPRPAARLHLRTVYGRQPIEVLVCIRVLDEWVHTVDIARATGREAVLPDGVAEALASGVLDTLPAIVLPRISERAGTLRLVVDTGAPDDPHGPRRTWGLDLPRRQYGPRVTTPPDATVRLHASTLALLAEGRDEPGEQVVVEGDAALAAVLLERLRR